jgi:hypothetical protein
MSSQLEGRPIAACELGSDGQTRLPWTDGIARGAGEDHRRVLLRRCETYPYLQQYFVLMLSSAAIRIQLSDENADIDPVPTGAGGASARSRHSEVRQRP